MATLSSTAKILNLSIEQKIGQMLIVGFRGLSIGDCPQLREQLQQGLVGGVILFDYDVPAKSSERNIHSPDQLTALTQELQAAARFPLFIGVDQEGGEIARLSPIHGFPQTASHKWLGQRNRLDVTREQSEALAKTLADCGVNLNFAPCVDLDVYPQNPIIGAKERSFSPDEDAVVQHAVEFIEAHHRQGVQCVLKHFPGHGSAHGDSHLGLVDVSSYWSDDELHPFERLIELHMADAVMTAHLFNEKHDPRYPATLSKYVITEMLREKIGFAGPVISDDLQMGAIARHYGLQLTLELALNAGIDMLLFANNSVYDVDIVDKVINNVQELLNNKRISEKQIDTSLLRIQLLKRRLI